jgi:uncharacterized membrane protein
MNKSRKSLRLIKNFMFQANILWFWLTLACSTSNVIFLFVSDTGDFLIFLRCVLGSVFAFWLPGYCFVRAFLPDRIPRILGSDDSNIEAITLCVVLSLALVTTIAFILNYTPLGVQQFSVVNSLFATTILLSGIGIFRQYYSHKKTRIALKQGQ